MKLRACASWLFIGFGTCVSAFGEPLSDLPNGMVLEYGLYEPVGRVVVHANPNTLSGKEKRGEEVHFIKQTDRIPARLGTSFGIRFQLTGIPDQEFELQKIVKHPPMKNSRGQMETQYFVTKRLFPKAGYVLATEGYSFDHAEELAPGIWTFEIWYHGQKLVSQSFEVYGVEEPIAVQAPTNLAGTSTPLQSAGRTNELFYFNNSQWTNYPDRLRSP
jgi:hypothetical protein